MVPGRIGGFCKYVMSRGAEVWDYFWCQFLDSVRFNVCSPADLDMAGYQIEILWKASHYYRLNTLTPYLVTCKPTHKAKPKSNI